MLKQWIYKSKLRSVKTAGEHHRIPRSEIERLIGTGNRASSKRRQKPVGLDAISGRNKLKGRVTDVRYAGLLVQVSIAIAGQTITSIITSDAAQSLGLKKGITVHALVKATEVMLIRG